MHTIQIENGKIPAIIGSTDFEKIKRSVFNFFKTKGMPLKPYPGIIFDCRKQKSLVNFCLGYYVPEEHEIRLFVRDRAPNDITRTMFHELVHHWQNINGIFEKLIKGITNKNADVGLHKGLTKLEREAEDKGFCLYREWARIHKSKKNPDTQFDSNPS